MNAQPLVYRRTLPNTPDICLKICRSCYRVCHAGVHLHRCNYYQDAAHTYNPFHSHYEPEEQEISALALQALYAVNIAAYETVTKQLLYQLIRTHYKKQNKSRRIYVNKIWNELQQEIVKLQQNNPES